MKERQGTERATIASSRHTLWRDARIIRITLQILFLLFVAALAGVLYANMVRGLERLGLNINFSFLSLEAGFGISEGIRYNLGDSYARAVIVGIVNTLRVSLTGIILATVLGFTVGLARLSSNWLIRTIGSIYVETLRNVPLLLQLLFWYTAVILKLPPVRQSISLYDSIFINQRGVYLPQPMRGDSFTWWLYIVLIGLALSTIIYFVHARRLRRAGRPGFPLLWAGAVALAVSVLGWITLPTSPITFVPPHLQGFNFLGGVVLSPEFAALLLGLTIYTSVFIAEVVRGGVQAVSKGQREAALAVGMKPLHVTFLIIVPQALRAIVPPLTSQYLNLFKNSSLAIAIGFPDLFSIGNTILNQTGQSIPVFIMMMAAYLTMSLVTSLFMNWYNHRVRLIER